MKQFSLLGCVILTLASVAGGQSSIAFEVASIKPAPPLTPEAVRSRQAHIGLHLDKAQADFGGYNLLSLITTAYRVRSFQITGPDWITRTKFDILAKLPVGASPDQMPEMLQTLLVDRFKLKISRESKEFPAYALLAGKDGPKLTPRPADYDPEAKNTTRPVSMEALANLLSDGADKPVVDKTELKGEYMISTADVMKPVMEQMVARARAASLAATGGAGQAASDPSGSGIFDIVQKLGLKLEARKIAMPLIVVDHVEKTPTEN